MTQTLAATIDIDINTGTNDNPIIIQGYSATVGDGTQAVIDGDSAANYCFNIAVANIMTKKFFVVVPYDPPILKKESIMAQFLQGIGRQVPKVEVSDFEKSYKELGQRTHLIVNGLAPLGLRAVQLNTRELIELFYSTYNPEVSMREELTEPEKVITKRMITKEEPNKKKLEA